MLNNQACLCPHIVRTVFYIGMCTHCKCTKGFVLLNAEYAVLWTGAWIITGGTHAGVMKHVGQAVRDYALSSSMQGQIVAIGVATWGIIHNRDALVHSEVYKHNYALASALHRKMNNLQGMHTLLQRSFLSSFSLSAGLFSSPLFDGHQGPGPTLLPG